MLQQGSDDSFRYSTSEITGYVPPMCLQPPFVQYMYMTVCTCMRCEQFARVTSVFAKCDNIEFCIKHFQRQESITRICEFYSVARVCSFSSSAISSVTSSPTTTCASQQSSTRSSSRRRFNGDNKDHALEATKHAVVSAAVFPLQPYSQRHLRKAAGTCCNYDS